MIDHQKVTALLSRIEHHRRITDKARADQHLQSLIMELIGAGGYGWIEKLFEPEHLSDDVRLALIKAEPNCIKMFASLEHGAYQDLAVAAILNKTGAALNIQASAITRDLLQRVFEVDGEALPVLIKFRPEIALPLIDSELLNLAVSTNLQAATRHIIGEALFNTITDEALKTGLRKDPTLTYALAQWGRLDVVQKLIVDGYWPVGPGHAQKPENLLAGVRALMKESSKVMWPAHWLKGYIKTHPIDEVVSLMIKQPARKKRLFEMYSTDELRPHAKGSRDVMRNLVSIDLEI